MLSVSSIFILLIAGVIVITWYRQLQAKEFAYKICVDACKEQDYQLLDQTVALKNFKITRHQSASWYIYRQYVFDYADFQHQRHQGYIEMNGLSVLTVAFEDSITDMQQTKPEASRENKVIPFPKPNKKR